MAENINLENPAVEENSMENLIDTPMESDLSTDTFESDGFSTRKTGIYIGSGVSICAIVGVVIEELIRTGKFQKWIDARKKRVDRRKLERSIKKAIRKAGTDDIETIMKILVKEDPAEDSKEKDA